MDDKTRPDETGYRFIGKPMPRKEDARLITGKGRFTDDFNLDGQAYAVMVRSPYPHARIVAIDAAAAKAMPGVLGVFTGADCAADKLATDPARSGAEDQIRHEAHRSRRRRGVHRAQCALAGRQGAPRRRSRGDGGGGDQGASHGCRRGGRGDLRGIAVRLAVRGRDAAGRAGAVGRGAEQRHGGDRVRQCRGDRSGVRPRRACGDEEFPYRQSHRRAARAARRARPLRRRDRPLHALCRLRRRGAAEERARFRCSASRPENLRVLSPDVGGNFGTRNRTFVEFGLVLWAREKNRPAGEIHRDALGSLPQRLSGPRSGDQGRTGARRETSLHRHARDQYQQCRRALRVAVAAEQGLRPHSRLLRHSGDDVARRRRVHQHHADQRLSQLRPAGGHLRHRAAGRHRRGAAWR